MAGCAAAMRHGYHGKRRRATAGCTRQIGAEGIVSKRAGSAYRSGESRDWLKAKVSETVAFVITGHIEREAVAASLRTGCWCRSDSSSSVWAARSCGSGSTGCALAQRRDRGPGAPRAGRRGAVFRPLPQLRDGVLLSVG